MSLLEVKEESGFFNARDLGDGKYDREYEASSFAKYFSNFISDGVYINPANQLKVMFKSGRTVIIKAGKAFIEGYWYELKEDATLSIPANTTPQNITTSVVLTLNRVERVISLNILENVGDALPRSTDSYKDLVLWSTIVRPNTPALLPADMTDRRPNKKYCGFVAAVVTDIDTSDLFSQFTQAFELWFDNTQESIETAISNTAINDKKVSAVTTYSSSKIAKIDTYASLEEVCQAFALQVKPYTMGEFLKVLPRNISIQFINAKTKSANVITDAPETDGVIHCVTNDDANQNSVVMFYSLASRGMYSYEHINSAKWVRFLSEKDVINSLQVKDFNKPLSAYMGYTLGESVDAIGQEVIIGNFGREWILTDEYTSIGNYYPNPVDDKNYKTTLGSDGHIQLKHTGIYLAIAKMSYTKKAHSSSGDIYLRITKGNSNMGNDVRYLHEGVYYGTLEHVTCFKGIVGDTIKAELSVDASLTEVYSLGADELTLVRLR